MEENLQQLISENQQPYASPMQVAQIFNGVLHLYLAPNTAMWPGYAPIVAHCLCFGNLNHCKHLYPAWHSTNRIRRGPQSASQRSYPCVWLAPQLQNQLSASYMSSFSEILSPASHTSRCQSSASNNQAPKQAAPIPTQEDPTRPTMSSNVLDSKWDTPSSSKKLQRESPKAATLYLPYSPHQQHQCYHCPMLQSQLQISHIAISVINPFSEDSSVFASSSILYTLFLLTYFAT